MSHQSDYSLLEMFAIKIITLQTYLPYLTINVESINIKNQVDNEEFDSSRNNEIMVNYRTSFLVYCKDTKGRNVSKEGGSILFFRNTQLRFVSIFV